MSDDVEVLSYRIPEACKAVSVSEATLRRAIRRGELRLRYLSEHPVIDRDDLIAWLKNAPTERAS
jgi:excisionase family DNA binding protein